MNTSKQFAIKTKIGTLYLVASEKGLLGVFTDKQKSPLIKSLSGSKILSQAAKQMTEYVSGKRKKFDLPLDMKGTDFQKRVWKQLQKIQYGKTQSYKDIAAGIKNPKAVRAVGTANGRNPFCIVIPCHRVIAADGTLGGYAGGLPMKRKLLALESATYKAA